MREKIINFKNILRIIISLFVIFSMIKSCAKALTYDEIKDYVNQTADYYSSNSNYQTIKSLVNNNANVITFLNNNASNYSAICLGRNISFNHAYGITLANFTTRSTNGTAWTGNGNYITISYDTRYSSTSAGSNTNFSNSSPSVFGYSIYMRSGADLYSQLTGMCYENFESYTGTIGATYVGKEHLTPAVNIYFGNMFSTTITYNGEEMQANELDYNYRIEFIDNVVTEDNEITSMVATLDSKELEVQDMGSYWTIKENNSTTLKYNQVYTLSVSAIVNGNEEEIEEKVIFVPPGTTISGGVITSIPSGDYGFSTENATNQIIENQNQNNTFWQDTYNSLFVMDSGDVDRLITDMKENIKIDNFGDVSGEIAILNTLTGEPSDFIIAWNPTQYMGKTIIPSGEINFSQKVREVPALKTTQDWLRIIMGYSITIVLMSEIFFTILRCLGVGVSIYEQHNEEIERLEEMHTPKIYDTEVMTPKGIKRYRTRRTRIQ